jgi:hypothetical protein
MKLTMRVSQSRGQVPCRADPGSTRSSPARRPGGSFAGAHRLDNVSHRPKVELIPWLALAESWTARDPLAFSQFVRTRSLHGVEAALLRRSPCANPSPGSLATRNLVASPFPVATLPGLCSGSDFRVASQPMWQPVGAAPEAPATRPLGGRHSRQHLPRPDRMRWACDPRSRTLRTHVKNAALGSTLGHACVITGPRSRGAEIRHAHRDFRKPPDR